MAGFGVVVLLAVLVGISARRRPATQPRITLVDRLFVSLSFWSVMLPAAIVGPLKLRAEFVPAMETALIFLGTLVVSCSPLATAQLIYRRRTGQWWTKPRSETPTPTETAQ